MKRFFFISLLFGFVLLLGLCFSPTGQTWRKMAAGTLLSSQHPYFAKFLVSQHDLAELTSIIYNPPSKQSKDLVPVTDNKKTLKVDIQVVETASFIAKIMKVNDPTTIHLVSSKYNNQGETLLDLIKEHKAVGGINAGGFVDKGGTGSGGEIIGIVISDGKVSSQPGADIHSKKLICGFTVTGSFITGSYSIQELLDRKVIQAVSFGPQLVVDGKNAVTAAINDAFGWAPRTAIGQSADGTVYMVVTDGRFYHDKRHRGASMQDMVDLFQQLSCVQAFALDGGGSTTMIYNQELQLQPATNTTSGMRYLPNAFVIIPHS